MLWIRLFLLASLGLGVAWPLLWPFVSLRHTPLTFDGSLVTLVQHTAWLVLGTVVLSLPPGFLAALLLERSDLPGRSLIYTILLVALFLPLPLFVAGWMPHLPPVQSMHLWPEGLLPSIFLHTLSGFTWVVLIIGVFLRHARSDGEDHARTVGSPLWVAWHVVLPTAWPSILAAALWLAMQTACQVTITDLYQVRTLAGEIFLQLDAPGSTYPIQGAIPVALLQVVVGMALIVIAARGFARRDEPGAMRRRSTPLFRLGRGRWSMGLLLLGLSAAILLVPTVTFLLRAGMMGDPPTFSLGKLAQRLAKAMVVDAPLWQRTICLGLGTGILCASLGLLACWCVRCSPVLQVGLALLMALAWAMPGPLVGMGVLGVLDLVVSFSEPFTSVPARWLWHGPSILPVLLVNVIRWLPCAVCLIWPEMRNLPREFRDEAQLVGLRPLQEFWQIGWPMTHSTVLLAALTTAILSLGEVSASKLVSTPGADCFGERL
ncbi:MAG: hypothetical protein U0840_05245 [Gemmataceae bacterium]